MRSIKMCEECGNEYTLAELEEVQEAGYTQGYDDASEEKDKEIEEAEEEAFERGREQGVEDVKDAPRDYDITHESLGDFEEALDFVCGDQWNHRVLQYIADAWDDNWGIRSDSHPEESIDALDSLISSLQDAIKEWKK
jgi:hypothetical protein